MISLVCDVCGGRLVMGNGNIATCQYCGLEYSTERLNEKITEIKGTVNVQGVVSAENLLERAQQFYRNKEIDKCIDYFNRYLDLKPHDEYVQKLVTDLEYQKNRRYQAGDVLRGTVVAIKEFGVFVEFFPGREGMVHVSKLSKDQIENIHDVVKMGDTLWVTCLGYDKMGRISFSAQDSEELRRKYEGAG